MSTNNVNKKENNRANSADKKQKQINNSNKVEY